MEGLVSGAQPEYSLGNDPQELVRLDRQAAAIERPTRMLLHAAGVGAGMRALDLGTGLGHVARILGEMVGPTGSVIGIDQSTDALSIARRRAEADGVVNVSFEQENVTTWRAPAPFDAVVGRLLLFHMGDPVAVIRHHLDNLRPGGSFIAIDYDIGSARSVPAVPFLEQTLDWVRAAFRAAGAWPDIGARLGLMLEDAGLERVATFGIQPYLSPRVAGGPPLLAGVLRSLAPVIVRHGIATAEQLDLATLETRIADAARNADAVILPPTVSAAWSVRAQ